MAWFSLRWPGLSRSSLLAFTGTVLSLSLSVSTGTVAIRCVDTDVIIFGGNDRDASTACKGATQAVDVLARIGLTNGRPITIHVDDRMEQIQGVPVIGFYDPESAQIRVASRFALNAGTTDATLFDLPINEPLYASVFAHEVTHAVIDSAVGDGPVRRLRPTRAAQEYVAYSIQLATLPDALRSRILNRITVSGFDAPVDVTETYLALAPNRFAVSAYRHFIDVDDREGFVHQFLEESSRIRDADE